MEINDNDLSLFPAGTPRHAWLVEDAEDIEIVQPAEHGPRLLFQVFCNGAPIAFARLRKLELDTRYDNRVVQLFSALRGSSYDLRLIHVAQNYRNRGIGTLLLKEIIHYCRYHKIRRLTGDIKGESAALRRWYGANGFTVARNDSLELRLS